MDDSNEARQVFAREFEKLHPIGGGPGFSLGYWSGRGDWAAYTIESRNAAGIKAVAELDELIANLIDFRARPAEAVGQE